MSKYIEKDKRYFLINNLGDPKVTHELFETFYHKLPESSLVIENFSLFQQFDIESFLKFKHIIGFSGYGCPFTFSDEYLDIFKENDIKVSYMGHCKENYFCYWLYWFKLKENKFSFTDKIINLSDINKPYLSYNSKPRPHRVGLVNRLKEKNLDLLGNLSLGQNYKNSYMSKPEPEDFPIYEIKDNTPKSSDSFFDRNDDIVFFVESFGNENVWHESFLNIITETFVHDNNLFITEKTLKPILGLRPFLLLSSPFNLDFLKKLDINLFDEWFGDWHSSKDYNVRLNKIINIIEYVCSLSKNERKNMFDDMFPVLLKNREMLLDEINNFDIPNIKFD